MLNELGRVFDGLNLSENTEDPVFSDLSEIKKVVDRAILKEKIEQQEAGILEKDGQAYEKTQLSFIEKEMPEFATRITWELSQLPQIFEDDILRKINDTVLYELLALAKRFMELQPPLSSVKTLPNNVSASRFQGDFYHKIEPLFKEIWLKVTGADTINHIMEGCRAVEKEAFFEAFKAETQACQTFQLEEQVQLCEFISKVYVLIYEDKRTF